MLVSTVIDDSDDEMEVEAEADDDSDDELVFFYFLFYNLGEWFDILFYLIGVLGGCGSLERNLSY